MKRYTIIAIALLVALTFCCTSITSTVPVSCGIQCLARNGDFVTCYQDCTYVLGGAGPATR